MNNKESDIIKLLLNFTTEENTTPTLPDNALLDVEVVRNLSKTISNLLYDSYKRKNRQAIITKKSIIELLKNWTQWNPFVSIDESNYEIFVKCLNEQLYTEPALYEKYGLNLIEVTANCPVLKPKDDWENICDTVETKYKLHTDNRLKTNYIHTWNKKMFAKMNLEYYPFIKPNRNVYTEKSIDYLNSFKLNSKVEIEDLTDDIHETLFKESVDLIQEATKIALCQSLLKLNRNPKNEKLFIFVIKELALNKTEKCLKFINNLWDDRDKLQLLPNFCKELCLNFQHLYEKPILKLAATTLSQINQPFILEDCESIVHDSNVDHMIKFCCSDFNLSNNLLMVFDKILELSKFDDRILLLINFIKQKYFVHNIQTNK